MNAGCYKVVTPCRCLSDGQPAADVSECRESRGPDLPTVNGAASSVSGGENATDRPTRV